MQRITNQSRVSATVILDSGILLFPVNEPDDKEQTESQCDVGYFAPTIIVYGDCNYKARFDLPAASMGQIIQIIHADSEGNPKGGGVAVTLDLRRTILRKLDIKYDEMVGIPTAADFDYVFQFSSGTMRPSSVKVRNFKLIKAGETTSTSPPMPIRKIAHDIVIHYMFEAGDQLIFTDGKGFTRSTGEFPDVYRHLDIEIIADHNTAYKYFCDAFGLQEKDHMLPNQGDPPPMGGKP